MIGSENESETGACPERPFLASVAEWPDGPACNEETGRHDDQPVPDIGPDELLHADLANGDVVEADVSGAVGQNSSADSHRSEILQSVYESQVALASEVTDETVSNITTSPETCLDIAARLGEQRVFSLVSQPDHVDWDRKHDENVAIATEPETES